MGARPEIHEGGYAPTESTEVRAKTLEITVSSARLEEIVFAAAQLARAPSQTGALELFGLLTELLSGALERGPRPVSTVQLRTSGSARRRSSLAARDLTDPIGALTTRERAVFELLVGGLSNEAAARQLAISVKTVQTHRAKINEKLDVHCPGQLVRFAALRGLIGT